MALKDEPDEGPPLSPSSGSSNGVDPNIDPAVLEMDNDIGERLSATALKSPFHLQGALELGQPMDHWDYSGTQDDLNAMDSEDNIVYMPGKGMKRYYPAMRTIIPIRFEQKDRKVLPVDSVGFFSFATFAWMTAPMWKLFRKGTFGYESYRCSIMESCMLNFQRLEYLWEEELKQRGPKEASLFRVSWRFMRTRVIVATFIYTLAILLGFLTPLIFLPILVNNAHKAEHYYLEGVLVAIGILLVDGFRAVLVSFHGAVYIRTGLRLRSAFLTMVYRKVVSMNTLGQTSGGQIMNLFSNDSARLLEYGQFLHMWVAGLVSIIVAFSWIIWELQAAGAAGVAAFLMFFFLQYACTVLIARYRANAVKLTDKRVQKTKEALTAVKVIKVNAWEQVFHKIISGIRGEELHQLHNVVFLHLLSTAMSNCLPSAAALVTFIACFALGNDLNPAQGFAALAVFMWSRHGIVFLPVSLGAIAQVKSTMFRVKELLLQPDTRPCISKPKDLGHSICLTKATFAWDRPVESGCDVGDLKLEMINNGKMNNCQHDNIESDATSPLTVSENAKYIEVLHDVSTAIQKGQLVGICGPMGSGKSSLLSAVLGQMHLLRGDLAIRGNAAYVPQQPWLIKATVRGNIILGDLLDPKHYYNAIRCCALNDDLHTLPAGDQTEVAEAGITLSGGQKQRVALARAVYSDRDIVLLDDPLASLDNLIAEYVFKHCIQGVLKDKTVLFATSQVKFLQSCDFIIFLRHGQIVEQGTPSELSELGGFYSNFVQESSTYGNPDITKELQEKSGLFRRRSSPTGKPSDGKESVASSRSADGSAAPSVVSLVDGRLVQAEEKGQGSITWSTYFEYIRAMGGVGIAIGITLSVIIFMAVTVLCSWYLGMILSKDSKGLLLNNPMNFASNISTYPSNVSDVISVDNDTIANGTLSERSADMEYKSDPTETTLYVMVFGILLLSMIITAIFQAFIFSKATIVASRRLHDRILDKIFHGTMRFFETTPIGRILNIFSKDLDEVDFMLATFLNVCCSLLAGSVLSYMMVAAVFPWFLLVLPVLGSLFLYVVLVFRSTSREVKRRENISRSPLFSHINATLTGLATLHAYEKEKLFENEFVRLQDDNSTLNHLLVGCIKWMGFRLDIVVTLATTVVAGLVVFLHGSVDPAFAALALVYCSTMGGLFNYTVRVTTETQARFTNVERILRYEQSLEEEGPGRSQPPTSREWPSKGQIIFENVDLRYRENLPLALTNVSFTVESNQKVAIVGRTGAGKSSIGVALFRLVNSSRGRILVDDVDISQISLHNLRSRMSIIPQDPVLFQGTIRFNLDPQNCYHDEEIWQALAKIRLQDKITSMDKQLSFVVAESGDNFSVGEKQLLCLARAILRGSQILFMDEATAAMDDDTNSLIHQVLMDSFNDCTILTIAHRLQHAQDYDRVLVLQDGKVVEFDDPKVLASNPSSLFAKMAQSGLS